MQGVSASLWATRNTPPTGPAFYLQDAVVADTSKLLLDNVHSNNLLFAPFSQSVLEAQFTYAPVAGQYAEASFDFIGDRKSQAWAWVQFYPTHLPTWFGSFRGQADKCLTALLINRVAVLTSDCLYLVNPDTKEVAFFPGHHYEDLIVSAQQDLVVAVEFSSFLLFNEQGQVAEIALPEGIDLVRFERAERTLIYFVYEEILDYQKRKGILDLVSLIVRL